MLVMKLIGNNSYGIFYYGRCGNYIIGNSLASKDNALLEFERRTKLIELASTNLEAFEQIISNNLNLFHGTNVNALPNILKYGLLSENESYKNDIPVSTGESWSRRQGVRRNFISFTDQIDTALHYSSIAPDIPSDLLSFGIIVGISSDNIKDLNTYKVPSDIPELGICDSLPVSKITTLFVPPDKIEFISKLVGDAKISVVGLDSMAPIIEPKKFTDKDMQNSAQKRKTSGIKQIMSSVKNFLNTVLKKNYRGNDGDRCD